VEGGRWALQSSLILDETKKGVSSGGRPFHARFPTLAALRNTLIQACIALGPRGGTQMIVTRSPSTNFPFIANQHNIRNAEKFNKAYRRGTPSPIVDISEA